MGKILLKKPTTSLVRLCIKLHISRYGYWPDTCASVLIMRQKPYPSPLNIEPAIAAGGALQKSLVACTIGGRTGAQAHLLDQWPDGEALHDDAENNHYVGDAHQQGAGHRIGQ